MWDSLFPTLDLHGRTAAEAEREAELWIAARRDEGEKTVRLITGRGLHSVGPAVLPVAIEELLGRLRGSTVAGYEREAGGGVYRVRLTPFPKAGAQPVRRTSTPVQKRDPELIRLASETLADLGIQPTPVLLEAEIQRIVKKRRHEAD